MDDAELRAIEEGARHPGFDGGGPLDTLALVAEVRRLRAWLEWIDSMADPNEGAKTNDWATAALTGAPPPQSDDDADA